MVYYSRALFSGRQKLTYGLAAISAAVLVVFNPRIAEAFIIFSLTGVVPGTDIVLSPDMVMGLAGACLAIGFVTAIVRTRLRTTRMRRSHVRIPVRVVSERTIPVIEASDICMALPLAEGNSVYPALRRKHKIRMLVSRLLRSIGDTVTIIGLCVVSVSLAIIRFVAATLHSILRGVRAAVSLAVRAVIGTCRAAFSLAAAAGRVLVLAVTATSRLIVQASVWFWRWSRPYLWKFDTWLEVQFRQVESKLTKTLKANESIRTIVSITHEYRKTAAELSPRMILQAARKKIAESKFL